MVPRQQFSPFLSFKKLDAAQPKAERWCYDVIYTACVWGVFGACLGSVGDVLGSVGEVLGTCWGSVGEVLGKCLGKCWGVFGCVWECLGVFGDQPRGRGPFC